ncbi:DUF962 domain-containing protein [Thalassotalea sp. PP2-459]|uniref:Mpo1 family 2-hydroxy fatty acid dioxygenase n=1 Tax=Thalassotalea sp. PP2-459 TaxID=1742724 RepID=UPI00094476B7|nr:Mpo1-like protein [Thalassotalea sp. PP2-459]OKY25426.1 hypothetical protein BI291_16270 [Thalassotalea sp. PP2-459]
MKSLTTQLSTYKSVHLNHKNIWTHVVGIPLIIWAAALMLSSIEFTVTFTGTDIKVNLLTIISLMILGYYFILSPTLALVAFLLFGPLIYSALALSSMDHKWFVAIGAFSIGWIFQFIGHGYEKAKPAFVDDLNQLLIGPLFLLAELCFACGKLSDLNKEVTRLAIEKRQVFEKDKIPG